MLELPQFGQSITKRGSFVACGVEPGVTHPVFCEVARELSPDRLRHASNFAKKVEVVRKEISLHFLHPLVFFTLPSFSLLFFILMSEQISSGHTSFD
jgi:hypothetical protein